jgi:hypothetical protein
MGAAVESKTSRNRSSRAMETNIKAVNQVLPGSGKPLQGRLPVK